MYRAPLEDLTFVLQELIGESALQACPPFAEYSNELATTVLQEAGRLAEEVLDPLYRSGDTEGARWTPEGVVTPAGFREAYAQFCAGGWPSLSADPEYGGQGMPSVLETATGELWAGANLAFKLCPMLSRGAIEAIERAGSPSQKALYLPKLIAGEWTGTMNLTEPQAGSDLAQVRTRAVPEGDHYRLFGQKIFITYGDHDYTDNIIHLVLARIEGAPAGVKGISLFLVPKVLVRPDGTPGERNDVHCLSIEHKLGIHASPTCVLAFGQQQGAIGQLIGEPNRGLEYMFIMMNAARLSVGLEGYAVAERAFQQAAAWARTRVQGKPAGLAKPGAPIIGHPDVLRMLLTMKSQVEAMRALALYAAFQLDLAQAHPDPDTRAAAQARGDLLIPIVKGWSTEGGIEIASLGIQVHGGMGYIEETGAAQALRDVRITTIYEGTTAIQANDLVGRKVGRDGGAALRALLAELERDLASISSDRAEVREVQAAVSLAVTTLRDSLATLLELSREPRRVLSVAVPFLKLSGLVLGGWLLARSAGIAAVRLAEGSADRRFLEGKIATAHFYALQLLPTTTALSATVRDGWRGVAALDPELV
jgi:acyl-CoA dehydrogenase